ncbi:Brefeldin A-inhibited guanine nucleotide-exchange protein 1 [Orchesella cincta]|uniref:Brefeldin A-inhibited guanine nucleotide-exchange protein 1 n=1 Tax=Orchesella cincta TaxID=48709 RepID=A0A1D2N8X1_ORCCI|nr:Brefeldin A-inhibited guanine nucleotide-exchange protein 1 [Orchesella cincta]
MSKNQFIKLNRAINGCEPLDEACLSTIYDEIDANYRRDAGTCEQMKWMASVEKSEEEILRTIKSILDSTSLLRSHFSLAKQLKHVKRMIKICGTSFLIALINALQSTNDTKLSDVCLDGLHSGIRVACILGLDNEREAYVQALAKLSVVALDEIRGKHINSKVVTTTTSSLTMTENGVTKTVVTTTTEMKCRSVDVILTLLDVGIAEGNHLGGSWLHILKFISQLLSTPLLAESRNSSRSSSPVPPPTGGGGSGWAAWAGSLRESLEKKLWDPSTTVLHPSVKESIASSVEKVFKRSELLTGDAMTEFFQALCQVVADYFCHLACSSKEEISTIAIDSIQKLVLKLLKKETLNGYRFQNHYFSPFKVIITNTRSQSTREAVLGFVETVISLYGDLLLSGWIAILSILVTNMLNHSDKDAADSFRVLQHIVDKCQKGEVNLRNSFGSIVKALIDIASNIAPTLEMSEQAFRLLTQMAEVPYRQPQLLMEENDGSRRYRVWSRGWKPILSELSNIFCNTNNSVNGNASCKLSNEGKLPSWDIKTKALITLFEVIKTYGSSFEKEWWNSVFEILFNIFSCMKSHEKQDLLATQTQLPSASSPSSSDGSYKYFYCYYYVQFAIFDVYTQYSDATGSYVFDELLKHLQWCICQDHEQIALSGVSCLQQLVVALGKRFSENQWDSILNVFQTICQPSGITQNNNLEGKASSNKDEIIPRQAPAIRAVIQLELLKIVERVIFSGSNRKSSSNSTDNADENATKSNSSTNEINPFLTSYQISIIVEILNRSHEIAKERCVIDTNNYEQESERKIEPPNFIPHETLSLQIYWRVLFSVFSRTEWSQSKLGISNEALWEIIKQSCIRSCGYFITIQLRDHRDAWADLLCYVMSNILELPKSHFEDMTSHLYPYFCDMLEVDLDSRICDKLREYLIQLGRDYAITHTKLKIEERNEDGAFENDSQFSAVPKTCNTSAQNQLFQPTFSEGYVNHSKDCQ